MVGELILGRFRIEGTVGSGGFGTVYRARDERLQREVAVKVIEGPEASPRVTREAQAVARLAHRNIATLYELAGEADRAYLVSELIEGDTLRVLGRRGELSDRLVCELGAGAAAALAHAHRNGVVHRDIKPENVLVGVGGEAKLVDFGIARITGERTLTATGDVLGTLAYMAPEQAAGQRAGPAADVYSLALSLYECLCGEHPLLRENAAATALAIGDEVEPLAAVRVDLPEQLCDVIDAALDPDPELRPLASELEGVLSAHAHALDEGPLPAVLRPSGLEEPPRSGPRRGLGRAAGAAGVAALTAGALAAAGASGALILAAPAAGLVAFARPQPGFAIGAATVVAWLALGAGEPGAALVAALLAAPLALLPSAAASTIALPALAPLLALLGVAGAYPAFAALAPAPKARALLGGLGFLWIAAWEVASGRTLLLGPEAAAPRDWATSLSAGLGDVLVPLLAPTVLVVAALWSAAAVVLPLLVRGRSPVLDLVGALIWAAALISAHRLLAGEGAEPGGLLVAVVTAACLAAFAAPRLRNGARRTSGSLSETSRGATA